MKKFLQLFTIYFSLFTLLQAAGVKAKVDVSEVVQGNVAKLYLQATGEDIVFPDITEIDGEMVVGTSMQSSSNITYVNGAMKSEKHHTKIIGFIPKKDMTIPSYTVKIDGNEYQTDPIDIKVVASKAPKLKQDAWYSFELSTEKNRVMAGESFVVTIFVSISDQIRGAKLAEFADPDMQGFYSQALGEPKQYRQNGYTVVEKQYLLTAKKEGNFTIGSATAKLGEADKRRRDFFGRYATQWHDIASNDLQIEVLPQPQKSDLIGVFTIDATIDATEVRANKPVNLTVKIEGKGNLEDFEFPKFEIDGVTVYSDDAKVQSSVVNGELHSSFTQNFAMISGEDFTIPAQSFSVYDPTTKKLEKLEIASYNIKVKEDKGALTATVSATAQKAPVSLTTPQKIETKVVEQIAWWMLTVAFIAGMLFMYLLLVLSSKLKRGNKRYKNDEALQILYPHINESSEVEEMVRKLYAKKSGEKSVKIDKKELKALIEKYTTT